jgi:hypothetical protein
MPSALPSEPRIPGTPPEIGPSRQGQPQTRPPQPSRVPNPQTPEHPGPDIRG